MDKVTLLTASRLEPTVAIGAHHSTLIAGRPNATIFALPLHWHRLFNSVLVFLCWRAYLVTYAVSAAAFIASKHVAFNTFIATQFLTKHSLIMVGTLIMGVWDSKTVQQIRARLFYEFAVFILGCGNCVILVVFWPGWLVLGAACFALWALFG